MYTDEMVKDKEHKAILKGFDLAIQALDNVKANFDPGVSMFSGTIEAPTIEKILNEIKDGCVDECVGWLLSERRDLLDYLVDNEPYEE